MKKSRVIKLENVSKSYRIGKTTFEILKDISLEIFAGEYIIIFGPSGCGKSTLLNIISGLETVDAGRVQIRGEDITKLNQSELAKYHRNKVGMVFQQFNLIKNLDVLDNVALPQVFSGIGIKRRTKRAMRLLKDLGLEKFAHNLPTEMSGGQQQRVAVARSLVNNPWIVIADEPTGNLDSKSASEVMELFKVLNEKSRRTVLMVTHNPEYVYFAHRVLYMRDGKIIKEVVNRDIRDLDQETGNIFDQYKDIEKDLTESEVETKSIVEEVIKENRMRNFNEGEFRRLIRVADDRRNSKITEAELLEIIDRPFKDGGVGLYKRTAEKMTLALEEKFSHLEPEEPKENTQSKINPDRIKEYYDKNEAVPEKMEAENEREKEVVAPPGPEEKSAVENDVNIGAEAEEELLPEKKVETPEENLELPTPKIEEINHSPEPEEKGKIIFIKDEDDKSKSED